MDRNQEWNMFLDNLLTCVSEAHRNTPAYECQKLYQQRLDAFFAAVLTPDQKITVEEILFELGSFREYELELAYHQGQKDSIWLLKNLGVLA